LEGLLKIWTEVSVVSLSLFRKFWNSALK